MLALSDTVRRRIADGVAALVLVALASWGMAGFELRMARYHADDSPVHYARIFAEPERYSRDVTIGVPTLIMLPSRVMTSAMVWTPALLWKYGGVDPYRVTRALTFAQGLLLGVSIYLLAVALTARRDLALMVSLAAILSAPWVWSPANYGNDAAWSYIPYSANLATGVLVVAVAAAALERTRSAIVALALGGLVHPLLGLHVAVLLAAYWLMFDREAGRLQIGRLAGVACATLLFMVPAARGALLTPEPLPRAELLPALRLNAHIFPWLVDGWWSGSAQQTASFLLLAAAAWFTAQRNAITRRLWIASLACALMFTAAHVLGALAGSPALLTLVGLRAWMWPVLLSLPIVVLGFWRTLETGSLPARFAAAALLVMPFIAGRYAVPLPLVAAAAAGWLAQRFEHRMFRVVLEGLSWFSAGAWMGLVTAVPQRASRDAGQLADVWRALCGAVDRPNPYLAIALPAIVAVVTCAAAWRRPSEHAAIRRITVLRWLGVVTAAVVTAAGARAAAIEASRPGTSDQHLLDAERWARAHTPPDATFLVLQDGWRTMTYRAGVEPFTRESYAYVAPRAAEDWRRTLLAFHGIDATRAASERGPALTAIQRERFREIGEADLLRFSETSGATHALIPVCYPQTTRTTFELPLAYENPCFRVYEISPAAIAALRARAEAEARAIAAAARFAQPAAVRIAARTREVLPPGALDLRQGTFVAWAKLSEPVPVYADLIRVNVSNALYVYLHAGQLHVLYGDGAIGAAPVAADEAWHHYALTWRDGTQVLYVDGVEKLTGSRNAPQAPVSLIALGWLGDRDGEQWNGEIGPLLTFSRPLAAGEIRALFAAGRPER